MEPDLAIFDCDGVLVDSEPIVNRIESEYFAALGFAIDPREAQRRFLGKTVGEVATAVEAALGRALGPEELYAWGMATADGLASELRAVDGVAGAIASFARDGVGVCVASQSPLPRVRLSLRTTGLARLFGKRVYTAAMVARPKPAPDLFEHAARAMGVPVSRAIVIEDSTTGVLAARAAGMTVFGYAAHTEGAALAAAGAIVFRDMTRLRELITVTPQP